MMMTSEAFIAAASVFDGSMGTAIDASAELTWCETSATTG